MEMSDTPKRKKILKYIKDTLLIILGTGLLGIGTGLFYIPFDLVTGGVSGLGIVLAKLIPIFSAEVYATLLVVLLFFVGVVLLGKHFAIHTLVSTIVYPIFLNFGSWLSSSGIFGGFFDLTSPMYADHSSAAIILAAVFGGVFVGAGCALSFLGGGSTGGSDIIPLVICKFFPKLKASVLIFITDAAIVVLGMLVINNLILTLLGVVAAFLCAIVIDKVFLGESGAFIAHIVSDKYAEISDAVIRQMNRTTTISNVVGGYSGTPKKLVMVTFSISQYRVFSTIVSSLDKDAFVTVYRAHEISGDGWTYNTEVE